MGDDIGSCSVCYCFSHNLRSAAQFVFKGQKTTLKDNLSLNPNQCHHPLITQLSLKIGQKTVKIFVRFLECLKTRKNSSEINWPLILQLKYYSLSLSSNTKRYQSIAAAVKVFSPKRVKWSFCSLLFVSFAQSLISICIDNLSFEFMGL